MKSLIKLARSSMLRVVLPISIIALAIAGFAHLKASKPQANKVDIQEKAWPVSVKMIKPGRNTPQIVLYGILESPRNARLTAAVQADVKHVLVNEGQLVEKGQKLVEFSAKEAELVYQQHQAELDDIAAQIKSEMNRHKYDQLALVQEQQLLEINNRMVTRAKKLLNTALTSDSAVDEAAASVNRQHLAVLARKNAIADHSVRLDQLLAHQVRITAVRDQAQLDLQRTVVSAPFAGRIVAVLVVPGERIRPGELLLRIYDTAHVQVRAQIPSTYVSAVQKALATNVTLKAVAILDDRRLGLNLLRFVGEMAANSGGVEALFGLQQQQSLVLGRRVKLVLDLLAVENSIALSPEALYGTNKIYRLTESRMHAVTVERMGLVLTDGQPAKILLRSLKLHTGDQIIITQLPNAISDLLVKIVE